MSGTIYKSYTMLTNPPDGFTVSIDPSSLTLSQQVLFAAPPPIGSTTPNTGAFTTLSATTPITPASGGTGSNAIPGAGSLLIGNSSGSYTVNQLTAGAGINITNASGAITISGASTGSSFTRTTITATGGQTTFSVSYGVGSIQVYLNGVMLAPADYTATSGTSVVLAVAAAAGDIFDAFSFTPQNITGVVPQANGGTGVSNASLTPITATGSTTARTLASWTGDVANLLAFGADPTGSTDSTSAFNAFIARALVSGAGFMPAGTYVLTGPLTVDLSAVRQKGTQIYGAGGQSTVLFIANSSTSPALTLEATSGASFYFEFCDFNVSSSCAAPTLAIGRNLGAPSNGASNYPDTANGWKIDGVTVNNASTSTSAIGLSLNGVYNCDIRATVNCAGYGDSLRVNYASFNTFRGSFSDANNAIHFSEYYSFGNVFEAVDLEVVNTCVLIDSSNANRNTFIGGQFVYTNGTGPAVAAINATAGAQNRFIGCNFNGPTVASGATGLIVYGTTGAVGQEQFGSLAVTGSSYFGSGSANAVSVIGGASTYAPQIVAYGTDANVDLRLSPQGSGSLWIGAYASGAPTATGYITVKDSTGTVRKLLCA